MNMRREPGAIELSQDVLANVARIDEIWTDCRTRYRGPFLFGAFGAADAMFAPVVSRLHTYAIPVGPVARAYMDAVMALPAWGEWQAAAAQERWVLPESSEISVTRSHIGHKATIGFGGGMKTLPFCGSR